MMEGKLFREMVIFITLIKVDARVTGLNEKIRKLDAELRQYKEQLARAKGPARNGIQQRAMKTLKMKKM